MSLAHPAVRLWPGGRRLPVGGGAVARVGTVQCERRQWSGSGVWGARGGVICGSEVRRRGSEGRPTPVTQQFCARGVGDGIAPCCPTGDRPGSGVGLRCRASDLRFEQVLHRAPWREDCRSVRQWAAWRTPQAVALFVFGPSRRRGGGASLQSCGCGGASHQGMRHTLRRPPHAEHAEALYILCVFPDRRYVSSSIFLVSYGRARPTCRSTLMGGGPVVRARVDRVGGHGRHGRGLTEVAPSCCGPVYMLASARRRSLSQVAQLIRRRPHHVRSRAPVSTPLLSLPVHHYTLPNLHASYPH